MFNPLKIQLRPPNCWSRFICAVHAVALLSTLFLPFDGFVKTVLCSTVILSLVSFGRFPINQSVTTILWNEDSQRFATLDKKGVQTEHHYPDQLLRLPFLICIKLRARAPVADQWLIVTTDMVTPQEWRRLQVLARWSELNA